MSSLSTSGQAGSPVKPGAALDIATAFLNAWVAQDFETVAGLLADDFAFEGPIAHYDSAESFLGGSRAFVARLEPRWSKIAAFGDDHEALLLYDLHLVSGAALRIADHYTVREGRIQAEQILWDTEGQR
ncbi:MAG: nuclear transport factor 2 family protein [Candidatus Dormibacteria bacterium]